MRSANYHTHHRRWGVPKKRIETSKKLLIYAVAMASLLSIVTVVAVFLLEDTSPLAYLIPSVFGLASTAYGFYFWKAKNENCRKFGNNVDDTDVM